MVVHGDDEGSLVLQSIDSASLCSKKIGGGTNRMATEKVKPKPERLNLEAIDTSLKTVEMHWTQIDDELDLRGIGRKDTPFTAPLRIRMMSAYRYLDDLLAQQMPPFSRESIEHMLVLNERVHYGTDQHLMSEYAKARKATAEKFYQHIEPIQQWYVQHTKRGNHPLKIAAEIYVSILGYPQLFIEGNHRTGSLIANWVTISNGFPPFILSVDNAIAYFAPSAEIKNFVNKSTWRGQVQLPKYRKSFLLFLESHLDSQYLIRESP
jgi:hypothetical protein